MPTIDDVSKGLRKLKIENQVQSENKKVSLRFAVSREHIGS
jgi:hypothetical protein